MRPRPQGAAACFVRRNPIVQEPHLLRRMEPVLPAGHNGEVRVMAPGERRYGFQGGQIVVLAVQNPRRNIP